MITELKNLQNKKGFIKYFKNTSWLFTERILRIIIGIFVSMWIARYLGPEKFGFLSYSLCFVGLLGFIAAGFDGIVQKKLLNNEKSNDEVMATAFWLKIIGNLLGIIAVFSISKNFTSNDAYENTLVLIIASSTIFHSFKVIDYYFQAKVMSKFVVYVNIISLFLSTVVKIILILNQAPLIAFVWVIFFDNFILASGFIYFYIKYNLTFRIKNSKFNGKIAIILIRHSWPLMLTSAAIMTYMSIDQVMIKEMINSEAVGQYAAAARISGAWNFIPTAIAVSVFPAIINAKKKSENLYQTRIQKLNDIMVWISLAIAIPVTFLSDQIIELLYGSQYSEAGSVLMIHIWSGVFVFLAVANERWIICENLQKFLAINTIIAAIVNIGLNYILIPKFGIEGAAWATLISYCLAGYLCLLIWKKTRISFINLTKSLLLITVLKKKYRWNIKYNL